MSARATLSKWATASIAPRLRDAGFRREGLTFERRRGEVTQLVNLRAPGDSSVSVYVGLIFDAIAALGANDTGSSLIGTRVVHFYARVHELVAGLPDAWNTSDATSGDAMRQALDPLIVVLDRIDSTRAMLDIGALGTGFEKVRRAQLKWTIGDRAGARADLEAVALEFADRHGCSVDELAKRAGLV